jgi:hypothetical protein
MNLQNRSSSRSGKYVSARPGLRTTLNRRPPRRCWDLGVWIASLWQPTTRPPHGRSGSRLPVEARGLFLVLAGRTAVSIKRSVLR